MGVAEIQKMNNCGKWSGVHRDMQAIGKELLAWIDENRHAGNAVVILVIRKGKKGARTLTKDLLTLPQIQNLMVRC